MADHKELLNLIDPHKMPKHIGIIMDGNGRWAKKHHRPRLFGHRAGAKATRQAVELAVEIKLPVLTMYAFSTENWSRPASEVTGLMKLLKELLIKEIPDLDRQNVFLRFIGSPENVDQALWQEIQAMTAVTHGNTGLNLNIAFNYGGRQEIIEGIKKLFKTSESNPEFISKLSPDVLGRYLYTAGHPDPDLIIRTSGEFRLSNFLLWQSAYSELYISPVLWPDFDKSEFCKAILDYQSRNRRFGGIEAT